MYKLLSLTILSMVVGATFAADGRRVRLDGVAAYVNDEVITISDVVRGSRELQASLGKADADTAALNKLYAASLESAIDQRLVLAAYDNQKRIAIPDTMVQERVDSIVNGPFKGDRSALIQALAKDGLSVDAWEKQIRESIIFTAMRNFEVDGKVRVSPIDIRSRYDAEPDRFSDPGKIKLSMIVFPADQRKQADDVLKELGAGGDFAALAREHSVGARAEQGGDRGWMEYDMLRDELAQAARALKSGDISDVIVAGEQLFVLKATDVKASTSKSFDDVQPLIERMLREEQTASLYEKWMTALKHDAFVRIVENAPF